VTQFDHQRLRGLFSGLLDRLIASGDIGGLDLPVTLDRGEDRIATIIRKSVADDS
jgi:hypothetical protein